MDIRIDMDQEEFAAAAEQVNPSLAATFEESVPRALRGSRAATTVYAAAIRMFSEQVAEALDPEHEHFDQNRRNILVIRSLRSPMSGWAARYGFGIGVAAFVAATGREIAPNLTSLQSPSGIPAIALEVDILAFDRNIERALRFQDEPIVVIERELGLDRTETGRLFGVSRQAVDQWMDSGIPNTRLEHVAAVLKVTEIMSPKLKPGRLKLAARRAAPGLGGKSLLEAMSTDPLTTAEQVENVFDWSGTA